jgi:hypothetical protein
MQKMITINLRSHVQNGDLKSSMDLFLSEIIMGENYIIT